MRQINKNIGKKKQTKQTLTPHFYILVGLRILYFPNEISGKTVDELSMIRYKAGCLLQIWCHTLHQPEKKKNKQTSVDYCLQTFL